MLDYENQSFLDIFHEDGLLIMSRGLGVNRIFINFLKVYSDPGSLVLVLNTTPSDEVYFTEQILKEGISHPPKIITNEVSATVRQSTYIEGGVLFITSRILVVDLLTDRVPVDHVSGILVYRAHKVVESCQQAFILRLYRQKNKTGFIKAFTDNPESFTSGFCHVERIMKNLFVKRLFLRPRFHASVVSCFNKHQVDVVEIHSQMTPAMTACQSFLLDIINACINELKRSTPSIDTDEITVENALSKSFELIIRLQLEPIWHQLSARSRQLVSDLKTLRLLLSHLVQYDCVTFYSLVQSIRTSERAFGQNTGWLFLESADSLFVRAKERVYGNAKMKEKNGKKQKKGKNVNDEEEEESEILDEEDLTPSLEPCPKWKALSEILDEIAIEEAAWDEVKKEEDEEGKDDIPNNTRILVCAEDDRTCSQLKEYLCDGGEKLLNRLFKKYLDMKKGYRVGNREDNGKRSKKKGDEDPDLVTLTQMARGSKDPSLNKDNEEQEKPPSITSSKDAYFGIVGSPMLVIHPLHGCSDPHGLGRTLDEIQPKYVVLYDPDMSLVRQLEVFKASRPGKPLRVYFMIYKGSVEEQRYLTTLRNEKEAFECLIKERASMVITEEQDGKSEDDPNLERGLQSSVSVGNSSRRGGQENTSGTPTVIVDMREFRSELPSLIHRRGIEIEPVTIEVGDYILTPDICVERKSVSDLIGSLNNGRLYQQALSMCRFYKRPILLIEFDSNKSFSLQATSTLSGSVSMQDVTSKLALLTMHFPKLRLLWCPSPYATAELFEELKAGKPQPTAEKALSVTSVTPEEPDWSDRYNHGPQDFVLRMPGINSRNYHLILKKFKNLYQVSQATLEELTEVLENSSHASQLHDFLHKEHMEEPQPGATKDKGKGKMESKGQGFSKGVGKAKGVTSGRGRGFKRKK